MIQGKIFELKNNIKVVAVYDNTPDCDRCDILYELSESCPHNTTKNSLKGIDCTKEKIIFKKVLTK